jgi:hypothetical protein
MGAFLKIMYEEPVELTYMGIGSAPHLSSENKLERKYDQLIPVCFHEMILQEKKPVRIVHFDPLFDRMKAFLDTYFQEWELIPVEFEGGYKWIGETLEVFVFPTTLSHKEDYWFFESLINLVLNTKGKLLLQEYTGYSLEELNKHLYEGCEQKEKYKRRILLDMTYGTDSGCSTDMTKAQPFYDYDGNFINLHFRSDQEVKCWVGVSLKLDDILRKLYTITYLQTLNLYHVDYRRRLRGEKGLYESTEYDDRSTPEEIMNILQRKLRESFEILLLVRGVEQNKKATLEELLRNFRLYDPYKWYDLVDKLILRP